MKKILFLGIGSALIFTMGGVGPAQADNGPHRSSAAAAGSLNNNVTVIGGAGRCASCHRAHTAKAEYLLKQAQPQLCYTCHDGTLAQTNVIDGNDGRTGIRGGGFANARINSAAATKDMGTVDTGHGYPAVNQQVPVLATGAPVTSRHLIDGNTAGTTWGNGTDASGIGKSLTLECGSCHDPHGNKNYRTLRPIPTDSGMVLQQIKAAVLYKAAVIADPTAVPPVVGSPEVLAAPAVMLPATGVKIPDAIAKVYTTDNYWLSGDSNVPVDPTAVLTGVKKTTDLAADGYINNIANWCTTCHTRYLATSGSWGKALVGTGTLVRTGQTTLTNVDVNYTYRHRSDANYRGSAANCITCHVSHGSNAAAGGGLNPGDSAAGQLALQPTGSDSRLLRVDNRGTCSMCHNV